jgi:hypothetical protein
MGFMGGFSSGVMRAAPHGAKAVRGRATPVWQNFAADRRRRTHAACTQQKLGQGGVKLVFDVQDVEAFKNACASQGLVFGSTHHGDGYTFANAKDPDKNSLSISSRAYRQHA